MTDPLSSNLVHPDLQMSEPIYLAHGRQIYVPDIQERSVPQMEQQPSFDPLSEPDMLAALTQAAPPLNSWMSFDEPDASPFHQPSDASTAFNRSSRSLDTSQVLICDAQMSPCDSLLALA